MAFKVKGWLKKNQAYTYKNSNTFAIKYLFFYYLILFLFLLKLTALILFLLKVALVVRLCGGGGLLWDQEMQLILVITPREIIL